MARKNFASLFLLLPVLLFVSCHRNGDTLIGRWEVERVNVEFDESKATPEMVRQIGEMEKDNVIIIAQDSLLTFISNGDTVRGRYSLQGTRLFCDDKPFGICENGMIRTESSTPLGRIEVLYRR